MKALSRLASPAGFALVLLLFLLLPFLSVSCDVPGMGKIGADYTGAHLALGDEPEAQVPPELADLGEELQSGDGAESGDGESQPPPDPGVQVLAIVTAVLMAAGIATVLISRTRTRLLGAAGVAALAGALVVVTQVVGQSNLTEQLRENARELGDVEGEGGLGSSPDDLIGEMIHTEVGFWLSLVGLVLIALVSLAFVVKDKIFTRPAGAGAPPPHGGGQSWMGGTPPAGGRPAGPPPPAGPAAPTEPDGGAVSVPPTGPAAGTTAVDISPAHGTAGERPPAAGSGENTQTEGPKAGDK
ncbi:hypothetical protein [Actinophytocola xanthii]|uniref:Uncharacterized protein n=1 Tax=Actinophytocola xanthii TaxID=1912961 RepID=A0A1Q8CWF4_9PSEU|nr:hypothetical protein [Actinophytocola xanthii]OLF18672.1 hypothetical protein BU204_05270 [Actinophytocola xanthii]